MHGGFNIYGYVANSNVWLDLFGLAPWGRGKAKFDKWWENASEQDVEDNLTSVKRHLRAKGGYHEMFPVSIAQKAKNLKFTPDELRGLVLPTKNLEFTICGKNGDHHRSKASSLFHEKLIKALKKANSHDEANKIIEKLHSKHVVGYSQLKNK